MTPRVRARLPRRVSLLPALGLVVACGGEAAAPVPDFRCHGGVNGVEGCLGYQAAMESGLIGNDDGSEAALGQFLNGRQTAGQKLELGRGFDVRRRIMVDNPVSIQKHNRRR